MRIPEFSAEQLCLLETIYTGFREAGTWPTTAFVDARLDQDHELDIDSILSDMPSSAVIAAGGYNENSKIQTSLPALRSVDAAAEDLQRFIDLIRFAADHEGETRPGPLEASRLDINSDLAAEIWDRMLEPPDIQRLFEIVRLTGINSGSSGPSDDGKWAIYFDRRLRPYRGVRDIDDYLARIPDPPQHVRVQPALAEPYVFILMPFDTGWSGNVKDAITRACEHVALQFAGLRWERADDITEPGRITDQIIAAIERADVIVADITESNPNVLFELGYADALNKPIVVLNQNVEATPFDIKDWRQIIYSPDDLSTLRESLVGFLAGPLRTQGFPLRTSRHTVTSSLCHYDGSMPDRVEHCAYCANTVLAGTEKPEHVIPASLGASLTVHTVCDACNTRAGHEIDQPFLADQLLRQHRSMVDQRDPRRGKKARRASSPLLQGFTPEGDFVTYDHELGRPVMGSRIVDLGEGRFQIRAGSQEEADRLMEKLHKRLASEGKEAKLENVERGESRPTIEGTIMVRTDVWRREAAKIGLAVGSYVYPPAWRLSEDADRLREWMHDRDSATKDGTAPPLVPTSPPTETPLARDDEHLLFFMRMGDGGTYVVVALFGRFWFAIPVDTTGAPVPRKAWRLDWRTPGKDGSTTWDELLADAALRYVDSHAA